MPISSNPPPAAPYRYSSPESQSPQESLNQKPSVKQMWQHYQEKAQMREAQVAKLKDQQTGHLISEKQRRNDFLKEEHETLQLIQGQVLSKEYLSQEEKTLEQAKLFFRKNAVAYLLANREKIEGLYTDAVKSNGRKIVASRDIMYLVGKKLSAEIFPILPEKYFQAFERAIGEFGYDLYQKSGAAVFELSRACPDYPVISSAEVDLDYLQDLDGIYGDILATMSGVGYSRWRRIQRKIDEIQATLLQYQNRYPALPNPQRLGVLTEPFRIFLIQEHTRLKADEALTGVSIDGTDSLADYIGKFEKKPAFLAQFSNWIRREYKNLPLLNLYQVICSIQSISQSQPDFAEILIQELENTLSRYSFDSKSVDYAQLDNDLTNFAAVIEYDKNHSQRKFS